MPSAKNCRKTLPFPAPAAARIATSRRRALARASSRLTTLAEAISNTSAAAADSTMSAGREEPTSFS